MSDDGVIRFPGFAAGPRDASAIAADDLVAAVEALLFAAGEPVTAAEIADALGLLDPTAVREVLAVIARRDGGLRLVEVAGGWQLRTDPRFADAVLRLRGARPQTMSRAALETLAILAYRQPVTRQEIDELRGVGSGNVLKTLLDKGYARVLGRRDEPGRPLEYGTTPLFLQMFELSSLDALPTLVEREDLGTPEVPPLQITLDEALGRPIDVVELDPGEGGS
jgi:segregation and condensation protein B